MLLPAEAGQPEKGTSPLVSSLWFVFGKGPMQRIMQGVCPFLGLLVLEPLEMPGRTGRLHGPTFDPWVDEKFGSRGCAGGRMHVLEKIQKLGPEARMLLGF